MHFFDACKKKYYSCFWNRELLLTPFINNASAIYFLYPDYLYQMETIHLPLIKIELSLAVFES